MSYKAGDLFFDFAKRSALSGFCHTVQNGFYKIYWAVFWDQQVPFSGHFYEVQSGNYYAASAAERGKTEIWQYLKIDSEKDHWEYPGL